MNDEFKRKELFEVEDRTARNLAQSILRSNLVFYQNITDAARALCDVNHHKAVYETSFQGGLTLWRTSIGVILVQPDGERVYQIHT